MTTGYWERQLTRRRLLQASAAGGVSLAALAALSCGGGSSGGSSSATTADNTSLIAKAVDTTSQAKRGGTYQYYNPTDETNLDPFTTSRGAGMGGIEINAYQKLLREKEFAGGTKQQVFEGDAAASYELSNDGLTLTAKLRPNNKFDQRAPTNGRTMNAGDVVYSWNRLEAQSTYASVLSYKRSDGAAPVLSVSNPDDMTVVYKMAFPWSALLAGIAEGGPHQIAPIEVDKDYNPKNTIRGSGPWTLEYEPSVAFNWSRNPGYYATDVPLLDKLSWPVLPEYATQLAQFRAKNIYDLSPTNQGDVPQTIKDATGVNVYQDAIGISHLHMFFSGRPDNPLRDVRLRRAVSMALDRKTFADVISEADTLRSFGLPPDIVINNNIPGGAQDYWLDPFSQKDMGDASQYFAFNQAEAKKQMAAAGYPNGLAVLARVSTQSHGAGRESDVALQMLQDVGFKVTNQPADYNNVFLPNILSARGDWDGNISFSGGGMGFSPATGLQRVWDPQGGTTRVSWQGNAWDADHQKITDGIHDALKELNPDAYRSKIYDLQKQMGAYQGAVIVNYQTGPFHLVWPWVQNWNAFLLARGGTGYRHLWIDDSKKS